MSTKKKDPTEPFVNGGWLEKFQLPETINSRTPEDLKLANEKQHARIQAELAVKKSADKLGEEKYQRFKLDVEWIGSRYVTMMKNPAPDKKDQLTMLTEWEKAARNLDEIEPDIISIGLVDAHLYSIGSDYSKFEKLLKRLVQGLVIEVSEMKPIARGRREKLLNSALAKEIRDLLGKYGLEAKKSDGGIWFSLLRIIYDAMGATKAHPSNYT